MTKLTQVEIDALMNRPLGRDATAAFIQAITSEPRCEVVEVQLQGPVAMKTPKRKSKANSSNLDQTAVESSGDAHVEHFK
jgi:hypothetical protein